MADLKCWNCGTGLNDVPLPISRHATCSKCFNELRCCRMCSNYEPDRVGAKCAEDRADPPVIKESANFCDWFRPSATAFSGATATKSESARTQLDELFGAEIGAETSTNAAEQPQSQQAQPSSAGDDARARLDALFVDKKDKN
jgi:hypothetical protein